MLNSFSQWMQNAETKLLEYIEIYKLSKPQGTYMHGIDWISGIEYFSGKEQKKKKKEKTLKDLDAAGFFR